MFDAIIYAIVSVCQCRIDQTSAKRSTVVFRKMADRFIIADRKDADFE